MPHFALVTALAAPPEQVFDLCLDVGEHARSMAAFRERAVRDSLPGRLGFGESVTFQARHFGVSWRLTARITAWDRPHRFVDEQVDGPFRYWRHEHRFESDGAGGTLMTDAVDFRSPLGPLGRIADAALLGRYLPRLVRARNDHLARTADGLAARSAHGTGRPADGTGDPADGLTD